MNSIPGWLPVAVVVLIYGARIFELRTRRDTQPGEIRETATFRLFLLSGNLLLAGAVAEFVLRGYQSHGWLIVAGVGCAGLSFVVRRSAIRALGRMWSLHIEMREDHQLVIEGPFRWVRHPTYFSMILELLSGALVLNAFIALGAVSLLFLPTLRMRLHLEEAAMVEKFGDAYRDYQRTTPALFPYKGRVACSHE